jgi:hypothetical protein
VNKGSHLIVVTVESFEAVQNSPINLKSSEIDVDFLHPWSAMTRRSMQAST